jgi:alkanesulfonate monooxygenase SsuD/methylene tetrahydromethanopterin reductase-like flavin-dependent oxidoreductase (luciferase family)
MLARQVSALHHLSNGRLTLGVSVGGHPGEYKALGIDMSKRVIRLRENITVLRKLLAGDEVTYSGNYYELEEAIVRPGVENTDTIPLYMGGGTTRVLRRAAELSDGWINGPFSSPSEFRESWTTVLEYARGFGRDPLSLEASKLVFVAANQDRNHARSSLKSFVDGYFGPSFDVDKHGITGTPSEVADRLGEFADAGVTLFMMGVPDLDVRHLETLAHQVIPRLKG